MAAKLSALGKVKGITKLNREIRRLSKLTDTDEVKNAILAIADNMKRDMRTKIHDDTGNAARGVLAKKHKRRGSGKAFVIADFGIAPHLHLIEFGTDTSRKPKKAKILFDKDTGIVYGTEVAPMPAQPFFRPTLDEWSGGRYQRRVISLLRNKLRSMYGT